jgi:ABC-type nitrate/sulfonate/bicarbonate transport system substrate-binding protein
MPRTRHPPQSKTFMHTLLYGVPTDKCAATVRLGIEKGFFRDEGIDLRVKVVYGGPPLASAYDRGDLQFGEIGSPPGTMFIARGYDMTVVGGALRRKAHMYLCVGKHIDDWEGLRGKRLGLLSRGSCPEWFMRAMLLERGFDPDHHLEYVGLSDEYARVVDVFREGRIDAYLAVEPAPSVGEVEGLVDVWGAVYDEPSLPQYQWIIHVAKRDFVWREPTLVEATLRACRRSAHHAATHVDEWVEFGAHHYGIDAAVMRRSIERELPHMHLDGQVDLAGLNEMIKLQQRLGAITRPLRAEDICDLRFTPDAASAVAA